MSGFFDSTNFMPHGMCLQWRVDLLSLHVLSDTIIALAYFSIPLALLAFVRRRPMIEHRGVLVMFAAFILLCGATHLISIWTIWNPDYLMQGFAKALTAGVSLITALALWPLLPKLLALPAPAELAATNARLADEIEQRREAETRYRTLAAALEQQVAERTERLQTLLADAASSERRFRGAFDNSRFGMAIGGLDAVWTEVNQTLCTMLGYSAEELLALTWRGITHPDDITTTAGLSDQLLSGEIDYYTLHKRYLSSGGEIIYAVLHVSLLRDDSGNPVFFMSQIQNVSDLVALEEAVRQSEARAGTVIETASDAIFELDGAGLIRNCNRSAERLLGCNREHLHACAFAELIARGDGTAVAWSELRPGSPQFGDEIEWVVTRADGQQVPVDIRLGGTDDPGNALFSAMVRDVSDRIAAQQALREAHEALRFHVSNSPLGVIEWDRDFQITHWSAATEDLFGWTSAEIVGRHPNSWQFVHEDDEAQVSELMLALSAGKTQRNHAMNRNYRKDGSVIHTEWFNSVRTNEAGEVVSILSFIDDITERVESARALLRSQAHTQAILDTAVDGIISIETDGIVRSYNHAAERIFGYAPEEVIGRNIKMLMPQPYQREHDGYLSNFLACGERKVIGIGREVFGQRKDGSSFPMELAVSEVRSEGQRTFTGFVRDISERKNFEREIIEGNLRLKAQDWLLSGHAGLTTHLQGDLGISEIGRRSLVFLCEYLGAQAGTFYLVDESSNLLQVAAYDSADAVATSSREAPVSGLARQAVREARPAQLGGGEGSGGLNLVTSFGRVPLRHVIAFPVSGEEQVEAVVEFGAVDALHGSHLELLEFVRSPLAMSIASARDRAQVSELLEASRQQAAILEHQRENLRSMNDDLRDRGRSLEQKNRELETVKRDIEEKARAIEQANHYKSEFLANMSHELRTPLNSMLILSRSLAENVAGMLSVGDVECARVIHRSGESLLALINDILDLSKVEAGMLDIELSPVSVEDLVTQLSEQFKPVAHQRGIEFRIDRPSADTIIVTDQLRLQQILRNLLSNAFKFTECGTVTLSARAEGEDGFTFAVTDTGIGIAAGDQERIFEAFQQIDGSTRRRFEGTGLGLSISRQLGHLLHARWEVTSNPHKGSRFRLRVPRQHPDFRPEQPPVSVARLAAEVTSVAMLPAATSLRDAHILIVDDDHRNSFALSRLLCERGASVGISDSGESALEKLAAQHFDLILMDMRMPDMNGCDVIRAIRSTSAYAGIPVIALTADTSKSTREEMLAAGACAFLHKPVDLTALFELLDENLHHAA